MHHDIGCTNTVPSRYYDLSIVFATPPKQVVQQLDAALSARIAQAMRARHWAFDVACPLLRRMLDLFARPSPKDLVELSRGKSLEWVKTLLFGAVVSAANPFIPGMILYVDLAGAAKEAPEGERRDIISLQTGVNYILLEILERLPKTVRGLEDMNTWSAVFEPGPEGFKRGPLIMALEKRKQMETFCGAPIVMDFFSRRFTRGLPDLRDTRGVLGDSMELKNLCSSNDRGDEGLVVGGREERIPRFQGNAQLLLSLLSPGVLWQGAISEFPGLTILPGAQFIVAGLVAMPYRFYRVPAMRMVMDVVVYLAMLAFFSNYVLFHDDGTLAWGEIVFAVYVAVSSLKL